MMTRAAWTPCFAASMLVGLLLLAGEIEIPRLIDAPTEGTHAPSASESCSPGARGLDAPQSAPLVGVWSRYELGSVGDPVRFYYFHGNGQGLYRYGRQGLTNTHSFDYEVDGDTLALRFRKTGQRHQTQLVVQRDARGRRWLQLADDPREPGARYRERAPGATFDGPSRELAVCETAIVDADAAASPVAGRIWIDHRNFATGGAEFHMYQFNAAGIDGRGIGWYHQGDFDDWTTEAFTYQLGAKSLHLWFLEHDERERTSLTRGEDEQGRPTLTLHEDPRDFWHRRRFVDAGASFGLAAFADVLRSTGQHPAPASH
ncbi:MAG: hypothetical protein B7733_10990 [Myxococcales bacterium FL481]|nr:MAG: hypothetical protein B7733_10990 [Myxococcales bacterium FL481]